MGAWIEMLGLESHESKLRVAPLVGAWIEIVRLAESRHYEDRRPPRGGVD